MKFQKYAVTNERDWAIQVAEKGTRYAVVRDDGRGDVAFVPYGLTQDCKNLATFISATPDLYDALKNLLIEIEKNLHPKTIEELSCIAKAHEAINKASPE